MQRKFNTMGNSEKDWKMWLGKRVCVKGSMCGTLQYFGTTRFSSGLWCGIALDCPLGKNNGTVNNVRYFKCEPKFGIFVQPCKVTKISKTKLEKTEHKTNINNSAFQSQNVSVSNINSNVTEESACGGMFNPLYSSTPKNSIRKAFTEFDSMKSILPVTEVNDKYLFDSQNDIKTFDYETLENNSKFPSMPTVLDLNNSKCKLTEDILNSDLDNTLRNTKLTVKGKYNLNETFNAVVTPSVTPSSNESKSSMDGDQKNLNSTTNLEEIVEINENSKNCSKENLSQTVCNKNSTFDHKFTNDVLQELLTNVRKSTIDLKMNETLNMSSRTCDSDDTIFENKIIFDSGPVKELCKDLNSEVDPKFISASADMFDNKIEKLGISEISTVNNFELTISKVDTKIKQRVHPSNQQTKFIKSHSDISNLEANLKKSCVNTSFTNKYSQQPDEDCDKKSNLFPTKMTHSQDISKRTSLPLMKSNSKIASVSNNKLNTSLSLLTKKLGSSQEILSSLHLKKISHSSPTNKIKNILKSSKLFGSNLKRSRNSCGSYSTEKNKSLEPQIKIPKLSKNEKPIDTKVAGLVKTNQAAESRTDSLTISSKGKIPVAVIKPRRSIGSLKVIKENKENLPITKSGLPTTSKQPLSAARRQSLNSFSSTSKEQESSNLRQINPSLRRSLLRNSIKSRIRPPKF